VVLVSASASIGLESTTRIGSVLLAQQYAVGETLSALDVLGAIDRGLDLIEHKVLYWLELYPICLLPWPLALLLLATTQQQLSSAESSYTIGKQQGAHLVQQGPH